MKCLSWLLLVRKGYRCYYPSLTNILYPLMLSFMNVHLFKLLLHLGGPEGEDSDSDFLIENCSTVCYSSKVSYCAISRNFIYLNHIK